MLGFGGAQYRIALRHNHQVTQSIGWQFKLSCRLFTRQHHFDAVLCLQFFARLDRVCACWQIDGGKRTQGTVVHHIRVCDGQDDAHRTSA